MTILERSVIGENVIIRAGALIGGDGFEPKYVAGKLVNINHTGGVWIGNNVEILHNTVIQRSVFGGFTKIGDETKIGSLALIGHNAKIGRNCEIASNSHIAGSTIIGDKVWIGPNATISSELKVGKGAYITLGSVVTKDVEKGKRVSGNFAVDHNLFIKFIKSIR